MYLTSLRSFLSPQSLAIAALNAAKSAEQKLAAEAKAAADKLAKGIKDAADKVAAEVTTLSHSIVRSQQDLLLTRPAALSCSPSLL